MVVRCSNGVGFVVLAAPPSVRTGIRVDIYDGADPSTLLATLPDTWVRRWNDPLRGAGSGSFKVYANNPILEANPGLLNYGNVARFSLDEVDRFAITIEGKDFTQVSEKGDAGRVREVSGRGVLAKLEDAQTYLTGGLTGNTERPFTENAGEAIRTLIAEAQARGGLVGVTTDFTDTLDSHNAPFLVPLDLTERAGADLLRISERHGAAYVDVNMTPGLVLQYFNTLGVDRSIQLVNAGPVILQPGDNIEELERSEEGAIRNALLIETPGGFLERIEGASITEHRRREGFLSLGNVASSDAVDRAADSVFAQSAQPAAQITLSVTDTEDKRPYVDWSKGDWILAPDEDGELTPYRVRGLTVSETKKGEPQFTPELATITEELEDRLERWLSSMAKGTLGGTAGNVAEPVKAAVEVVDAIDSGIGDHLALQPHHDELGDLSDVDLAGLNDLDIIRYNQGAGAWEPEALPSGSGALEHLAVLTPSAVTEIDVTLPAGYAGIRIIANVVASAGFPEEIRARMGDTTIDTGANYDWARGFHGDSHGGGAGDGETSILALFADGSDQPFEISIPLGYDDGGKLTDLLLWSLTVSGTAQNDRYHAGRYMVAAAVDILRLYVASGTLTGTLHVYGLKTS